MNDEIIGYEQIDINQNAALAAAPFIKTQNTSYVDWGDLLQILDEYYI
ncbi:hypothetical protein ACQ4M3_12310 [Leptolyngbya sp. AN03gr2]